MVEPPADPPAERKRSADSPPAEADEATAETEVDDSSPRPDVAKPARERPALGKSTKRPAGGEPDSAGVAKPSKSGEAAPARSSTKEPEPVKVAGTTAKAKDDRKTKSGGKAKKTKSAKKKKTKSAKKKMKKRKRKKEK